MDADFAPLKTRLRADLTGKRFGRLLVVKPLGTRWGKVYWLCRCDCGGWNTVSTGGLRWGQTESCGCLYDDTRGLTTRTHGLSNTPEHRIWKGMHTRCYNPRRKLYHRYGGRGISICQRWRKDFEAFLADMGPKPSPKHTIERIDNDGNYEPGNCRWATNEEQGQNTSRSHRITFRGETLSANAWTRRLHRAKKTILEHAEAGRPIDTPRRRRLR